MVCSTVNGIFFRGRVVDGMIERVIIAREGDQAACHRPPRGVSTYLSVFEKMPLSSLILVIHAELISTIMDISNVGRSDITHVHVSMPAAIADGVKTSKGKATM
jgi:hypothetical protein